MSNLDLTISIINHSNPQMLRDCIRSIYATTHDIRFDIWVVDNATGGAMVDEIRAEFPEVRWLFNDRRMGFAANHNQVLSRSVARHTCILNDDMIVHEGAFDRLVRCMDDHPRIGMLGPRLLNADGTVQASLFRDMRIGSELLGALILPGALARRRTLPDQSLEGATPREVDWILGACIVVRREALAQIGVMDERLSPVANTEETDWCMRARAAGWAVAACGAAEITHFGGQSMKRTSGDADRFTIEMYRTRLALFEKHHGRRSSMLLGLLYAATLPWNLAMLAQSYVRRRTSWAEFRGAALTHCGIARLGAGAAIGASPARMPVQVKPRPGAAANVKRPVSEPLSTLPGAAT